jgi:hypothetical protein
VNVHGLHADVRLSRAGKDFNPAVAIVRDGVGMGLPEEPAAVGKSLSPIDESGTWHGQ